MLFHKGRDALRVWRECGEIGVGVSLKREEAQLS